MPRLSDYLQLEQSCPSQEAAGVTPLTTRPAQTLQPHAGLQQSQSAAAAQAADVVHAEVARLAQQHSNR